MSEDRRAPKGYHPEADLLWEVGRQAELYVLDVLEALKAGNVEVKADNRERATGRVFIEYACQWHDGVWHESGVYETAAEVWVFVLRSSLLVAAPVWVLRDMTRRIVVKGQPAGRDWGIVEKPAGPGNERATRGVVVPLERLLPWLCAFADASS